jgi:hypothetical protein
MARISQAGGGPGRRRDEGAPASSRDSSLRLVSERFERIRAQTHRLFDRDADFRDLCDEYEACAQGLARLQARGPESRGMCTEYRLLLLRLERELLRHLEERMDTRES